MKTLSLQRGLAIALALSLGGSVLSTALSPLLPAAQLLRLVIALAGLGYILFLLSHSEVRSGRLSALLAWMALAAAGWFAAPPLLLYLLLHIAAICLLRSLYFYSSAVSALLDLGLGALGLAASSWAMAWSGSLLLAIWCFFLVQSLCVAIPVSLERGAGKGAIAGDSHGNFQSASHAAEDALRRLSANPHKHRGPVK